MRLAILGTFIVVSVIGLVLWPIIDFLIGNYSMAAVTGALILGSIWMMFDTNEPFSGI